MMDDHDEIWLEPKDHYDPDTGRMWCQHNVWGDEAVRYVRASASMTASDLPDEGMEPVAILAELRKPGAYYDDPTVLERAASAIERLQRERDSLAKQVAALTEALTLIENCGRHGSHNDPVPYHDLRRIARAALKEKP